MEKQKFGHVAFSGGGVTTLSTNKTNIYFMSISFLFDWLPFANFLAVQFTNFGGDLLIPS